MILQVKNGCFSYKKDEPVLKNISFSASPGDLIAVLGPNGAGKTTLLRCMMGFLQWNNGESTIDSCNINDIPARQLWSHVSYVPQARNVSSAYTVGQTVLLGRNNRLGVFSQPGTEDIEAVEHILEKLGISEIKNKKCSQISGGELQMALIARALASDPEILILDEPESNLDFRNQLIILETMSELSANGITCIFNTHYPAHALQRANKAILISKSGSCIFGNTHQIVTEENIQSAFGVKAVIGEIETPENTFRNILPIGLARSRDMPEKKQSPKKIAVISIITDDFEKSEKINSYLHEYNQYLIGRMGMPYRSGGVYIISAALDAPESEIQFLTSKLSAISSVSVKATYAH